MIRKLPIILAILAVTIGIVMMSAFRVDERQQAIVLQFGQVKQVITEPGLKFKVPFIQDVTFYEDRILPIETSELEVTPADERRLVVDAFARWRISDVVSFRQAVQTEFAAVPRLERILNAALRQVLGSVNSSDVLSPERSALMERIRNLARSEAKNLGIEIVDVRIRRADLPEQNLNATFERMNAERQREAADERARGRERAQEVRATADREAVVLTSSAEREAQIVRGEADAERNGILASAYGRDEEFFAFYRSLQAYEKSIQGKNSTLVISPDSSFFEYLASPGTALPEGAPRGPVAEDERTGALLPDAGLAPADGGEAAPAEGGAAAPAEGDAAAAPAEAAPAGAAAPADGGETPAGAPAAPGDGPTAPAD